MNKVSRMRNCRFFQILFHSLSQIILTLMLNTTTYLKLCKVKTIRSTIKYLSNVMCFNPLNAELKPICRLLVFLGYLTFMGACIVSIFQYISNKMQSYTVYLYLETVLHVSGGTFTHNQELIQLYLQHLLFVTPLLLSAAIVEELEPV
jgi:hypothetical protein